MIAFRSMAGWRLAQLGPDLVAGLTLVAIAIPEQMATSRLGGFPPALGLLVFIAGTVGFAVLGASRVLSAGADSTVTPIFAGSLALLAATGSPAYASLAATLALMTGAILMACGVFRLGWIADLISIPVMTGFLAGIAIHIVASQLPTMLGVPAGGGGLIHDLVAVAGKVGDANLYALALTFGVAAVMFATDKLDDRIPGALIALIAAALVSYLFGLEQRGVPTIGALSIGAMTIALPNAGLADFYRLVPLALICAAVVMVQTATTTRAFPGQDDAPDVSRDFLGVGLGGVLSGLAGGFVVNASPPRTGAVSGSGGRSQLAGLAGVLIVGALLLFGGTMIGHVPVAALAGVLLFVALSLVRVSVFVTLWRQSTREFLLVIATAAAIVLLPIETGVGVGIVLSVLHGLGTIGLARPIEFDHLPGTTIWWPPNPSVPGEKVPGVLVLSFQAPLAFFNADIFERGAMHMINGRAGLKLAVLEAAALVHVDFTAAQAVARIVRHCRDAGIDVAVARLESVRAQAALERFGVAALLGRDHFFHSVADAVATLGKRD
jgi:MFS superfamily sulfate permease-like transporter